MDAFPAEGEFLPTDSGILVKFCPLRDFLHVDRSSFDCEDDGVNNFLKNSAERCEEQDFSRVFLMLSSENEIVGYYTLSSGTIPLDELPNRFRRGCPQIPVPSVLIGQFGIDKTFQRRKLSKYLSGDAYRRIRLAYRQRVLAFKAVRVDTQTEKAKEYWKKEGFIPFKQSQNSLFILVNTILNAFDSG
ncbi:MAG: hypothetical protein WCA07_02260 [Gloeobacterales cyanobacterium]